MPFTIDEEAMKTRLSLDVSKPQTAGAYPADAVPVKQIPHLEFPRVVYKHPKEPFRKIEHRNTHHEVVDIEVVPSEHLSKIVQDKKELEQATKDGWSLKPYIAQATPDPNADLYA